MKIPRLPTIFGLLGVAVLTSFVINPVGAAPAANPNAAQGLEISPSKVEINAERGKSYLIKLKLTNITPDNLTYTSSVEDFNAKDETGSPQILFDSNLPATASIKTWVRGVNEFSLKTREIRELIVTLAVPADAEPGGHYGVLKFSGSSPTLSDTGVGLSASTGLLLLVRVDGDVREKASLVEFFATQGTKPSMFFEQAPVKLVARIRNEGNIHVKPEGKIELRDIFGNIVSTLPVNKDKANVLPSSIRRFETSYNKDWMIGPYTATLALGYGTTGQAITNSFTFWMVPYKIILVVLAVLVTLFYILRTMIRRRDERLIERARRGTNKRRR